MPLIGRKARFHRYCNKDIINIMIIMVIILLVFHGYFQFLMLRMLQKKLSLQSGLILNQLCFQEHWEDFIQPKGMEFDK